MKRLVLAACIAAALFCSDGAEARTKRQKPDRYDVYLLIGQSNMAGRGKLEPCDTAAIPGVYVLDEHDSIVPARGALNIYSTIRKGRRMQGIGPGNSFGRAMAERTGHKVLLVVNARGGSSIGKWSKGANAGDFNRREGDDPERVGTPMPSFFDEAVRRTRVATRHGKLRAILWHQGESNAKNAPADYKKKLSALADDLREELGVSENVPFIVGETGRLFKNEALINPTLRAVSKYVPNSACVSSEGCPMNSDSLHFSREGQRILGERYADEVLKKVKLQQ